MEVIAGDADDRITSFVDRHGAKVFGSITLVASNREEAEDAFAEALARAWDHLTRGRQIDSLEAWVFVVASNELRRSARRRLRRPHPERGATTVEDSPNLDHAGLGPAIRALPKRQRQVVVLRYWFDLPLSDIARGMGIAEGTVKALLHQARSSLREMISIIEGATR